MKALREDREEEIDDNDPDMPEFISAEVTVLVQEGLDDYFAQELVDLVCIDSSYPPPTVETVDVPDQVDAADIRSGSWINCSIGVTNISGI